MHHTNCNRTLSLGLFRALEYSSRLTGPERVAGDVILKVGEERRQIIAPGMKHRISMRSGEVRDR
jgi:hypothetical protein